MLTTDQRSTLLPCHLSLSPWTLYLALSLLGWVSLCLAAFVQYIKRHCQQASLTNDAHTDPWPQLSAMEKAKPKPPTASTSPPGSSACDILKPLSQNSSFPSSGTVAAKAREQMQTADSPTSTSSPVATQSFSGSSDETREPTHRRTESVQQMRDVDAEGERSWRRLIVEYR